MGIGSSTVKVLTRAKAPPKAAAKPKFNAKLRTKLQRQRGDQYSNTPKDPAEVAELQSYYHGRQELKQMAYNDARDKRRAVVAGGSFTGLMGGATALSMYQESERKKAEAMLKKKPSYNKKPAAAAGKPKSRLGIPVPGEVKAKKMPLRGKPKAKAKA